MEPPWGGVGQIFFLLIFWAVHDISWTFCFDPLETPMGPPVVGWVKFISAENESHIYPNMCAKCGCGPTVVSKKGGGGTNRQTDRQTKGRCSFI